MKETISDFSSRRPLQHVNEQSAPGGSPWICRSLWEAAERCLQIPWNTRTENCAQETARSCKYLGSRGSVLEAVLVCFHSEPSRTIWCHQTDQKSHVWCLLFCLKTTGEPSDSKTGFYSCSIFRGTFCRHAGFNLDMYFTDILNVKSSLFIYLFILFPVEILQYKKSTWKSHHRPRCFILEIVQIS